MQILGFDSWVRKIPWRRKWQPTPVFLPVKSHGQRNLVGSSPWGHKESDITYQLNKSNKTVQQRGLFSFLHPTSICWGPIWIQTFWGNSASPQADLQMLENTVSASPCSLNTYYMPAWPQSLPEGRIIIGYKIITSRGRQLAEIKPCSDCILC